MLRFYLLLVMILTSAAMCAAGVLLFPPPNKTLSAETMPYMPMLHTGVEDGEFYTRGRFGVDFPIVGYDFGNAGTNESHNKIALGSDDRVSAVSSHNKKAFGLGITAAAHINMIPTSSMKFPVDNFYAVLALNLAGVYGDNFSWRFYPIYHVSAHLADGHPTDIMKENVRAVSSEMIRGEVYYKPFGEILELGAGAGWYYHVCAQKDLKAKADVSVLITPPVNIMDGMINPYALLRGENVIQDGNNFGMDISAGVMLIKDKRGFGLSIRYFNHLHPSYYYMDYEKGWGMEYTFMF